MTQTAKIVMHVALGLCLGIGCLALTPSLPAQNSAVSDSGSQVLAGLWVSEWTVDGMDIPVALGFYKDGTCVLMVTGKDGKIHKEQGSYRFEPRDYPVSPDVPPDGVLTLRLGRTLVEKVHWKSRNAFVFVGSESHPWGRID
jgi:hypothetical protein